MDKRFCTLSSEPVNGFEPHMHFSESVHVNTKLDFDNLDLIFKVTPALCYVNFRPKYGFCQLSLEPNNGFGQFIYTYAQKKHTTY